MSIRRRLDKLERDIEPQSCPMCGHGSRGGIVFHMVTDETMSPLSGQKPASSDPCPACGREPECFTIRIEYAKQDDLADE